MPNCRTAVDRTDSPVTLPRNRRKSTSHQSPPIARLKNRLGFPVGNFFFITSKIFCLKNTFAPTQEEHLNHCQSQDSKIDLQLDFQFVISFNTQPLAFTILSNPRFSASR
ncbi:hypothetical protein K0M31_004031, partial [Melipona bicolor]